MADWRARRIVTVSAELAAFADNLGLRWVRVGRGRLLWPPRTLRHLLDTRSGSHRLALTRGHIATMRRQAALAGYVGPLFADGPADVAEAA